MRKVSLAGCTLCMFGSNQKHFGKVIRLPSSVLCREWWSRDVNYHFKDSCGHLMGGY